MGHARLPVRLNGIGRARRGMFWCSRYIAWIKAFVREEVGGATAGALNKVALHPARGTAHGARGAHRMGARAHDARSRTSHVRDRVADVRENTTGARLYYIPRRPRPRRRQGPARAAREHAPARAGARRARAPLYARAARRVTIAPKSSKSKMRSSETRGVRLGFGLMNIYIYTCWDLSPF